MHTDITVARTPTCDPIDPVASNGHRFKGVVMHSDASVDSPHKPPVQQNGGYTDLVTRSASTPLLGRSGGLPARHASLGWLCGLTPLSRELHAALPSGPFDAVWSSRGHGGHDVISPDRSQASMVSDLCTTTTRSSSLLLPLPATYRQQDLYHMLGPDAQVLVWRGGVIAPPQARFFFSLSFFPHVISRTSFLEDPHPDLSTVQS
jgi:hypothetical protein